VRSEEKQIPRCARDDILGALSFRSRNSGSSGARNLLLVAASGRAVALSASSRTRDDLPERRTAQFEQRELQLCRLRRRRAPALQNFGRRGADSQDGIRCQGRIDQKAMHAPPGVDVTAVLGATRSQVSPITDGLFPERASY
jgi:hypothetical protein